MPGQSRTLSHQERSILEPAVDHDLGAIRVHDDASASRTAAALYSQAFTVGHHIVLGADASRRSEAGLDPVLTHEVAHAVQQAGSPELGAAAERLTRTPRSIAPLEESDCASDCTSPVGTDGPAGEFRLIAYADKDSFGPFPLQMKTTKVGHSWLKLVDPTGNYWVYGFWPQEGFDPDSPFADVAGCVWTTESQGGHTPTAQQEFILTETEFLAARDFAQQTCANRPAYNLFGLQCTEFVGRVLAAAGRGPLGGFGLFIESPNALDAMLEEDQLLVGLSFGVAGTGPIGASSVSFDAEWRGQLTSALTGRLRLYALGRGQLGAGAANLSGGLGLGLRPHTPYLPSLRISAGVAGGDVSFGRLGDQLGLAGFGSAGVEFRLDELLAIGTEYQVLGDVARRDPVVQRLLVNLRVPF